MTGSIDARRAMQSERVLDMLDALICSGVAVTVTRDCYDVAIVRHPHLGTFRGSSVRDALAQMLQASL